MTKPNKAAKAATEEPAATSPPVATDPGAEGAALNGAQANGENSPAQDGDVPPAAPASAAAPPTTAAADKPADQVTVRVAALGPVSHDQVIYAEGEQITLRAAAADALIASGVAEPV
jgi:hypothetical protein